MAQLHNGVETEEHDGQKNPSVLFRSGDREADGKRLAPLMALGIKCGDEVIVEVDGPDEVAACAALETVLKEHL